MDRRIPASRRLAALGLVLLGLALIPLPGPGTAMVLTGLVVAGLRMPWVARFRSWAPEALHQLIDQVSGLEPSLAVEQVRAGTR